MDGPRRVTVVGAGIVGICCALYLQRRGDAVTVIDPQDPGAEASRSNAGILSTGGVVPIGTPGVLRQVPRMLRDPLAPLTIRWQYLPRLAPWLVRFVRASAPARVEAISAALKALVEPALASYEPLWQSAEAGPVIRSGGLLYAYQSDRSFAEAQGSLELRRRRGIAFEILDGVQVAELEPALAGVVKHAVFYPKTLFTSDPQRLVELLAGDFVRRGGRLVRDRVTGFELGPDGPRAVRTPRGTQPTEVVVVAAGAWSRPLAAQLGSRVPLDTERGYVAVLPQPNVEVRRALISGDHHLAITPMDEGLRLSGTVELAGLAAPPNYARADKLIEGARRLFPRLAVDGVRRWMSFRPSLPDSLPVIGRSLHHGSVVFAFGHGHLGLSLAAITGQLVAELVHGDPPSVDVRPYRVDRF